LAENIRHPERRPRAVTNLAYDMPVIDGFPDIARPAGHMGAN